MLRRGTLQHPGGAGHVRGGLAGAGRPTATPWCRSGARARHGGHATATAGLRSFSCHLPRRRRSVSGPRPAPDAHRAPGRLVVPPGEWRGSFPGLFLLLRKQRYPATSRREEDVLLREDHGMGAAGRCGGATSTGGTRAGRGYNKEGKRCQWKTRKITSRPIFGPGPYGKRSILVLFLPSSSKLLKQKA